MPKRQKQLPTVIAVESEDKKGYNKTPPQNHPCSMPRRSRVDADGWNEAAQIEWDGLNKMNTFEHGVSYSELRRRGIVPGKNIVDMKMLLPGTSDIGRSAASILTRPTDRRPIGRSVGSVGSVNRSSLHSRGPESISISRPPQAQAQHQLGAGRCAPTSMGGDQEEIQAQEAVATEETCTLRDGSAVGYEAACLAATTEATCKEMAEHCVWSGEAAVGGGDAGAADSSMALYMSVAVALGVGVASWCAYKYKQVRLLHGSTHTAALSRASCI